MTILEVLKKYPEDETELLLSHLLKWDKTKVYLNPDKKLTTLQDNKLKNYIRDLRKGIPFAYILGYKYFYGLNFKVSPAVLIPRPETEWIIDKALQYTNQFKSPNILDVGTGSGCIAITVKKHLSNTKVFASDISKEALKIAKRNAKAHNTKITFYNTSLIPPVKTSFDIIIANLPYVPERFYKKNLANLKYEPKSALVDSNKNGDLYVKLLHQISKLKYQPKYLILEIGPELTLIIKKQVELLFPKSKLSFFKDLNKFDRYAIIEF
jgi:release factor glutamine methyltransferase